MTPAERERAVALLEETRERLLRTAQGLSPAQWQYKPAPNQWSVAELVEHIAYVEGLTLTGIDRALQKEPVSIQPSEEDNALVKRISGRGQRLTAPERVVPSGRWALEELIPQFEAARKRSLEFAKTTEAPLRQHGFPHPSHCERHRRQAEEVMGAAGFPRAATVS